MIKNLISAITNGAKNQKAIIKEAIEKNVIESFSEPYKNTKVIEFTNGCTFHCDEDSWYGYTPYAVETFFTNKKIDTVLEWLEFWEKDRDET